MCNDCFVWYTERVFNGDETLPSPWPCIKISTWHGCDMSRVSQSRLTMNTWERGSCNSSPKKIVAYKKVWDKFETSKVARSLMAQWYGNISRLCTGALHSLHQQVLNLEKPSASEAKRNVDPTHIWKCCFMVLLIRWNILWTTLGFSWISCAKIMWWLDYP